MPLVFRVYSDFIEITPKKEIKRPGTPPLAQTPPGTPLGSAALALPSQGGLSVPKDPSRQYDLTHRAKPEDTVAFGGHAHVPKIF